MARALRFWLQVFIVALLSGHTQSTPYLIDVTRHDESSPAKPSWTGQLKLYKDTKFRSLLITLTFNTANLCFNLACGEIDDSISSASWKGLPLSASFKGGTKSLLIFYSGIDCTGMNQGWPTSFEKAPDFRAVQMNDQASSFMLLVSDTQAINGYQNICDYKKRNSQ